MVSKTILLVAAMQSLLTSHPTVKACHEASDALVKVTLYDARIVPGCDTDIPIHISFDEDITAIKKFRDECLLKAKRK